MRAHIGGLGRYSKISLFGVADAKEMSDVVALYPNAHLFERGFPGRWFRGKGLRRSIETAVRDLDVLHAHMLWDHSVYAAWKAARGAGKPLIITPHGSLGAPWRYTSWHKRAYSAISVDRILKDTSFLLALNVAEKSSCEEYGVPCPVRVIPNGLPVSEYLRERNADPAWKRWPQLRGRRTMLYLGRLWGEKGLDILPDAWAEVAFSASGRDWMLVIAGPDYRNYESILRGRIRHLGIEDRTLVAGPVFGELKDALLSASDLFVLPSHGEGFSMAILEAMAAGIPVLFTRNCHFPELAACGGGWEIPDRQDDLVRMLHHAAGLEPGRLQSIGENGRTLGKERYTIERVTKELLAVYREALGR